MFGLAEMRRYVRCLISDLGRDRDPGSPYSRTNDPGKTYFDITGNVQFLAQNRDLRMIVLSDPED